MLFIFTRKNKQLLENLQKRTINWDKLIVRLRGCDLPQILKVISDHESNKFSRIGNVGFCSMKLRKKSASPKKKFGYCKQDSIVFVDKWVNCLFGCLSQALYGGGTILAICGFSSDLDQNRAVLWSKSELETPETPETLEAPETLDVDVRNVVLSTFQRTWWQS